MPLINIMNEKEPISSFGAKDTCAQTVSVIYYCLLGVLRENEK